jgi:chaperonin GroEL
LCASKPILGDIEKVRAIATISANNNTEIGNLIADAFKQIGNEGVITLEDSKTDKSEIDILGGYHFNRGMVSPYFMTNPVKANCELENPLILLYDKKISKVNDLYAVLEYSLKYPYGDG